MEKYNLIQTSSILSFSQNEDNGKWPFPKTSAAKIIKNKNKNTQTWTAQGPKHRSYSGQLVDHL